MRIATWNINSLRARMDRVLAFLERHEVDVLALQEIKAVLAKLNPKALAKKGNDPVGDAKDAKDAIVGSVKNPLDGPYLIPGLPPIHPPLVPAISTPSY